MALTFNSTYYYQQRPDVLEAYLASGMSVSAAVFAQNHYDQFGWKEGSNPNPVFDTDEYLAANADVAAAGVNPFVHYQTFGQAEGRAPNASFPSLEEFNWEVYIAANADLQAAGINTAAEAYDHFITFGYAEGRPGTPAALSFTLEEAIAAGDDLPVGYTLTTSSLTGVQTLASVAAAAAIVAGAANADELEFGGDFTVEDSAENVLADAADGELSVDVSIITITDENLTMEQRDALLDLGFEGEDLPPLTGDDALAEALGTLQDSFEARADALAEAALIDNAEATLDGGPGLSGAALDGFVAAYTEAQLDAEVALAEAAVNTSLATLATARAGTTDATLQTNYDTTLAAALADTAPGGARDLLNARTAAQAALDADLAADGSNVELLTELRDDLVSAVAEGLVSTTQVDTAGPVTVAQLIDSLNAFLAGAPTEATAAVRVTTIATYDSLANLNLTDADASSDAVVQRDGLISAVTAAQAALALDVEGNAFATAEAALECPPDSHR